MRDNDCLAANTTPQAAKAVGVSPMSAGSARLNGQQSGTVLDQRFELREFLGAGNFGAVYRAKQLVFGRPIRDVALKLFKSDRVTRENVHEVFADAVTLIGLQEECPDPDVGRA